MSSAAALYTDAAWRRVRLAVLRRDRYICQWCGDPATQVDHVVPLIEGGERLAPSNLVASCLPCNARRGQATSVRRLAVRRLAPGSGMIRA